MASSINTVSGNRVAGLASGMDTESIVEKMLSGTQSKIDKQTGLKQQLEWKQEMVRGIITDINSFHDKYFSFYSSANTSAIKVISAASNAAGKVTIDSIDQLASACKVKSRDRVSGELKGTVIDPGQFTEESYSFEMTLDGVSRTISFISSRKKAASGIPSRNCLRFNPDPCPFLVSSAIPRFTEITFFPYAKILSIVSL